MAPPKIDSRLIAFSSMGLELGLSVLVGLWVGSKLDAYFGTDPWLLILFLGFGLASGYRSLYRLWKKTQQPPPSD